MKHDRTVLAVLLLVAPLLLWAQPAEKNYQRRSVGSLQKTSGAPFATVFDINNWSVWAKADGWHPNNHLGYSAGTYPKGVTVGTFGYSSGWIFAGKVSDGVTPVIRSGGGMDRPGMSAGKILSDITGKTTGAENPASANVRIWRVRPDWQTADLKGDAGFFFDKDLGAVTDADVQAVKNQYQTDWNEWPAAKGAPFEDKNGNGVYDPSVDIPGIPGAGQTVWLVANDLDPAKSTSFFGSPPTGLEFQMTMWGYATNTPINDCVFLRGKYIYKGTTATPSNAHIDSMYVCHWSDDCLGDWTDDFDGCDTTLNLGYSWNSTTLDANFASVGVPVPSDGWVFLQGVAKRTGNPGDSAIVDLKWKKGYKFVLDKPLSGFSRGAAGVQEPNYPDGNYNSTLQWFNVLRGYKPTPVYPQGVPVVDLSTGRATHYAVPGDPVQKTGWIDGQDIPPGDRRVTMIHGPFTMNLGDTVEIVLAMVGGAGADNLSSITVMKYNVLFAQYAYDNLFLLPSPPPTPQVSAAQLNDEIVLSWGDATIAPSIEASNNNGFSFEGYNVFQFPSSGASVSSAVKVATFDLVDQVTTIVDKVVDPSTGVVVDKPVETGRNSGVQRFIDLKQDAISSTPLVNGQDYYFAVTTYSYNGSPTVPFHALESAPVVFRVRPQSSKPGTRYNASVGDTLKSSSAEVFGIVLDPSIVDGSTYSVTIDTAGGSRWSLSKGGTIVKSGQTNFSGDGTYPVVGGLQVKIVKGSGSLIPGTFTFSSPTVTSSQTLASADVDLINAYPNPYYGYNAQELTRAGKFVTFSHLPRHATIRIYTLSAALVKVIAKDDDTQFVTWDVRNQNNLPVASGIYIVHIDLPDIGKSKILKMALVQEDQFLNIY